MDGTTQHSDDLHYLHKRVVRVYQYVISRELRYAVNYGTVGGLVTGLLGHYPALVLLRRQLSSPDTITDSAFSPIIFGLAAYLFVGLAITLIALSTSWKAPSLKTAMATGAGVGLFFALAAHSALIGGVSGVIANREQFLFYYRAYEEATRIQISYVALYRTIAEYEIVILAMMGLCILLGALLGGFAFSRADDRGLYHVRDAAGSFVAIILPLSFYVMAVIDIIFTALLGEGAMVASLAARGVTYVPPVLITALPLLVGQLLVQLLVLLWLWRRQPADVHRGMLRFAQVLYGLGATVGQVLLYLLVNPGFLSVWYGQITVGLSVIMAAAFAVLAQIKLHRAPREHDPVVKLDLTAQDIAGAGRAVVIILWLLADALTIRLLYNVPYVTFSAMSASLPDKPVALDSVLTRALPQGTLNSLIYLVVFLVVSYLPLRLVAWLATLWERRWAKKGLEVGSAGLS